MNGIADATVEIIRADVRAHTTIEWERVEWLLGERDALAARVRELETALQAGWDADGVTPDDAPQAIDDLPPSNAWVEGYEAGQNSVCDTQRAALAPTRRDA